jgi:hypothetical protein
MSMMFDPYTEMVFGRNAIRVPAWYYLRNHGEGVVSITGASKVPDNPLLMKSDRDLRFCVGEIIVRPSVVIGSDAFQGYTTGQLHTNHHNLHSLTSDGKGEVLLGDPTTIPGLTD